MRKYALLTGLLWCFVSCSTDESDTVQNTDINQSTLKEITPTSDPDKNWDKTRHHDNDPSDDDGN
ncbi:MAG: hypothetical protein RBR78_07455 [Flavobacteriaceae bacterium]|jgi:hypothetical protein|nr:hypothetical protein [Flavobacteriaceae bacterium]